MESYNHQSGNSALKTFKERRPYGKDMLIKIDEHRGFLKLKLSVWYFSLLVFNQMNTAHLDSINGYLD